MRADVFCNNNPIGTIDWTPDACGVQVNLDCAVCGDELLRCYAVVNGNILRVGLPAPEHGRLRLRRHLSRQMLHETGCEGEPERFYLASAPAFAAEQCAAQAAACHRRYGPGRASIQRKRADSADRDRTASAMSFDPKKPFALAPAFVLCRTEGNTAVLEWKKDAADAAASSEKA